MTKDTRQSGSRLILAGIVGCGFFWLTDPRWGHGEKLDGQTQTNIVEAINDAQIATAVGFVGSAAIAGMGVWLLTRRSV